MQTMQLLWLINYLEIIHHHGSSTWKNKRDMISSRINIKFTYRTLLLLLLLNI